MIVSGLRRLYRQAPSLRYSSADMGSVLRQCRPRHNFAPLGSSQNDSQRSNLMQLKGIVFDMDGTLCKTYILIMYPALETAMKC